MTDPPDVGKQSTCIFGFRSSCPSSQDKTKWYFTNEIINIKVPVNIMAV
jgi:hypothetical protein